MRRDFLREARALWADDDAVAGGVVALAFFVCVIVLITYGIL